MANDFTNCTLKYDVSAAAEGTDVVTPSKDSDIHGGTVQVLDMGAWSTDETAVRQCFFEIEDKEGNQMSRVDTENAHLWLIGGYLPAGFQINCGIAAAWSATPTSAAAMKGMYNAANELATYGVADDLGYKFANLKVLKNQGSLTTPLYDPAELSGRAGYPLCMLEYPYIKRYDPGSILNSDKGLTAIQAYGDIFVVPKTKNGSEKVMMLVGCTDKKFEITDTLSSESIKKGLSTFATAITENERMITGRTYTFSHWFIQNVFLRDRIEEGRFVYFDRNTTRSNPSEYEVVIRTQTRLGYAMYIHVPDAVILPTGSIPLGETEAPIEFEVHCQNFDRWGFSKYPVDYSLFALKYAEIA
jgi:hypothetical protein